MIFSQEQLERMGAAAAKHRTARTLELEISERTAPLEQSSGQLVPMNQQLDAAGELHDIAPRTARERLFEPAPEQIPGQLGLELGSEG